MDLQRRDEFKQKLYELTPADGKSIGNATLRRLLRDAFPSETFSLGDYWDLRNALIADAKLETGRGRGGSVRRVITVAEPVAVVNATGSVAPLWAHFKWSWLQPLFMIPFTSAFQAVDI